jgi:transposase
MKNNQKEYIRKRLRLIKLLWDGKSEKEASEEVKLSKRIVNKILNTIVTLGVEKGLIEISKPKRMPKPRKLNPQQIEEVIKMVETETPRDYGYDKNIFTGAIIVEIIKDKYGISLSDQSVYNLLDKNNISYHKAHKDYIEADEILQKKYQESIKKTGKQNK